jgi:two-component system heavy metal sensor histidine kinase CusS
MLRRLSLPRLSLTSRLSFFFTLVAACVLLGLSGLFMTAADRHFSDLDRSTLQDKQHLIDDILTSANSAEDLRWRLRITQSSSWPVRASHHAHRAEAV